MTDYEISQEGLSDAIEACEQQETPEHLRAAAAEARGRAMQEAEASAGLAEWARGLSDAYLEGHNVASWNSHYTRAERDAMDTEIARRAAGCPAGREREAEAGS